MMICKSSNNSSKRKVFLRIFLIMAVKRVKKETSDETFCLSEVFIGGTTRIRTGDTRIFSPMLYQLSYGTISFV